MESGRDREVLPSPATSGSSEGIPNLEMLPLQHLTAKEWWLYFQLLQRSELLPQAEQTHFGRLYASLSVWSPPTAQGWNKRLTGEPEGPVQLLQYRTCCSPDWLIHPFPAEDIRSSHQLALK